MTSLAIVTRGSSDVIVNKARPLVEFIVATASVPAHKLYFP